jgi:exportin-7
VVVFGLDFPETNVSSQCCTILNRWVTFQITPEQYNKSPSLYALMNNLQSLFAQQILPMLFSKVLFEDCSNQWSMSRPMFALMLWMPQVCRTVPHKAAYFFF